MAKKRAEKPAYEVFFEILKRYSQKKREDTPMSQEYILKRICHRIKKEMKGAKISEKRLMEIIDELKQIRISLPKDDERKVYIISLIRTLAQRKRWLSA